MEAAPVTVSGCSPETVTPEVLFDKRQNWEISI